MDTQNTPPIDMHPDVIPIKKLSDLQPQTPLTPRGAGTSLMRPINSVNYKPAVQGWNLDHSGAVEFNGGYVVSTHFTPIFSALGKTFYMSDGTTPNGNLSGNTGDVCFGADSGKAYKCTSTTTWVSFT